MSEDSSDAVAILYVEGCNAFRHYSNTVLVVRTITIAQGLAAIGSAAYLLQVGSHPYYALCASVFCFFLTAVLFALHKNYYGYAQCLLEDVCIREKTLEEHDDRTEAQQVGQEGVVQGPWRCYKCKRDDITKSWWRRMALHFGPFVLCYVASSVLILISGIAILTGG